MAFERRLCCVLVLVAAITLSGCATVYTHVQLHAANDHHDMCDVSRELGRPILFTGVWYDVNGFIRQPWTCQGEDCGAGILYPGYLVVGIIDMPLSLVADTVLLPHTVPLHYQCKERPLKGAVMSGT